MSSPPSQLPPKREVALALLESASSLYIHLDPRSEEVMVPIWFKKQPQLVLQVGLNMAVPIVDLDVGDDGISCTLSFNRRAEYCRLPWKAIFGLVGEDGRGMIWPESVPAEVAASAEGRAQVAAKGKVKNPKLRLASVQADAEQGPRAASADASELGDDSTIQAAVDVAAPGVHGAAQARKRSNAEAEKVAPKAEKASKSPKAEQASKSPKTEKSPKAEQASKSPKAEKSPGRPPYLRLVK
jgi:stringent starvation protein B